MYLNIEMVMWVLVTFLQILCKFPNESVSKIGDTCYSQQCLWPLSETDSIITVELLISVYQKGKIKKYFFTDALTKQLYTFFKMWVFWGWKY